MIRDDGSNDDTVKIIKDFKEEYQNIIFIEDEYSSKTPQQNFSYLLQYAYAMQSYDYYMFCDQDDIWLDNKVEVTLQAFEALEVLHPHRALLVHTDLQIVDADLMIKDDSFWHYADIDPFCNELNNLLLKNTVTGCTVMINNKLAQYALPFPVEMLHDWWLALIASAVGKIGVLPQSPILYRLHGSNNSGIDQYTLRYVFGKFFALFRTDSIDYFAKYITQAERLYHRVQSDLDLQKRELMTQFIGLKSSSKLHKIMTVFRYRLFKQGRLRTFGMLLQLVLRRESR